MHVGNSTENGLIDLIVRQNVFIRSNINVSYYVYHIVNVSKLNTPYKYTSIPL